MAFYSLRDAVSWVWWSGSTGKVAIEELLFSFEGFAETRQGFLADSNFCLDVRKSCGRRRGRSQLMLKPLQHVFQKEDMDTEGVLHGSTILVAEVAEWPVFD
jgi:hypothetical protein